MLGPRLLVGVTIGLVSVLILALTTLSAAVNAGYVPGQIIVKFAPEVDKLEVQNRNGIVSMGITSLDRRMEQYEVERISQLFPHKTSQMAQIYQFDFDPSYDAKAVARDFSQAKHLLYAEPRYLHHACDTPNDPNFQNGLQWFFNNVHAVEAWDITHGNHSVIIAIVDVGVDWDHPDLMDNRWVNYGEDLNGDSLIDGRDWNGIDDDGNGFIDDFYGWDFAGIVGTPDPFPDEGAAGHGSHTAGVACGATNNELANAGMAWNCSFMPVKVSMDGGVQMTHGYEGIQYAADNGAAVINLSWARADSASAFEQEVIDSAFAKGAILVAAAGNDEPGNAFSPPEECPLTFPATYDHVTAVAATDMADRAAEFTFYGPWVDVCAPGNACYSHLWNDSYGMRSSSSVACALVSATAALLKVIEPDINSDEFEDRMWTTSDNIDAQNASYVGLLGGGRLNAYRALANIVSVAESHSAAGTVPQEYNLHQNYPNPFNPGTYISYSLPVPGRVELSIYNVRGQLVRTLVDHAQPAGQHLAQWDGRDTRGQLATSGIYFYRLTANGWSQAKKMILMK
ncbi:S8 family serine peptidase [Candidatus Zixiibacteriota bacterium]